MMKRLTWFVGGVAAGASGMGYVRKTVKAKAAQVSPVGIARSAVQRTRGRVGLVADAVRDGRQAMHQHEDELKARRDGRLTTLDQHVVPGDQVFVDGVEVDSDRVVVMRKK